MYEGEHKLSVVSDLLWCAEVVGGDFGINFESRDFPLDTKTVSRSFALLGSQAARRPERLGSQGGCPSWMPSGCTKH